MSSIMAAMSPRLMHFLAFSTVLITTTLYFIIYKHYGQYRFKYFLHKPKRQVQPKRILLWTVAYQDPTVYRFDGCPVDTCIATNNRALLNESDAVLFFHFSSKRWDFDDIPSARRKDQLYIFHSFEAISTERMQGNMSRYTKYRYIFNLTMSYRNDSDIVVPYGKFSEINTPSPSRKRINHAKNKTKLVATMIRNKVFVPGGRRKIIRRLKNFLSIDNLGGKCRDVGENCYETMLKPYKFYLAFENSYCKDYVTEKLFLALKQPIVPVVFGAADYFSIAPPHSYINVLDFKSIKDLADYLKMLDQNDKLYNEYFHWKSKYRIVMRGNLCELCKAVHRKYEQPQIRDIYKWWVQNYDCRRYSPSLSEYSIMKEFYNITYQ